MAADQLEPAIDALYQAPLDQFTAKRNELAAALKKAGDRANADRVKALAKPGSAAWAVNQAWWRDPDAVRALLDAGASLRRAHMAFANGKATDIRAAVEARQQAVDAVIDLALDALGGAVKVAPDLRQRIAVTVEALASSGVPERLAPGRLTADLQASGFEALSAMAGLTESASSPSPSPPPAPSRPTLVPRPAEAPGVSRKEAREAAKAELAAREREHQIERAAARLEQSEAALREATSEMKETAAAEKTARQELEAANEAAAALEGQLEQARERQREARRAASQASQSASQAEMSSARAARDAEKARDQLGEAKRS